MLTFRITLVLLFLFFAQCSEVDRLRSTVNKLDKKLAQLEREQTSIKELEARLSQLENKTPDFYNCDSAPCLNGGSCIDTGVEGGYVCVCQPTFSGLQCNETLHDYSFLVSVNGFPMDTVSFATIIWDDVVENPGGHYDPSTGIYTAPFTGLYEFVIQKRSNENMGDFQLRINGVAFMSTPEGDGFADAMQTAASTLTVPLNAGDEVSVINHLSTGIWGSDIIHGFETWFSGKLLFIARD